MSIEGQGHFFTIYFPGFVCFVLYWAKISGERLQDHWSSGYYIMDVTFYTPPLQKVGGIMLYPPFKNLRLSVRAHEKTLVEYTWNSVHRLPHTHAPSKFLRFIVNENHNGINLFCIFKGNYKR